jgi:hypothetical protein
VNLIPPDEYNAHPGISKSAICAARIDGETVSMLHMRAEMIRDRTDKGTEAMQKGTLAHAALLEPGALLDRCAVWQGESKRGKEWAAFKEANEGRIIVTETDLARIADMSRAIRAHPLAREIVGRIEHAERPIEWTDPNYGLAKARPDGCGADLLVEYKTSRQIGVRWFCSDAWRRGYHLGLAWYWYGLAQPANVWIVNQESAAPYACACYPVDAGQLAIWYADAARIATRYRICEQHGGAAGGIYPGPYDAPQAFERPAWAGGEDEQDTSDGEMEASEL